MAFYAGDEEDDDNLVAGGGEPAPASVQSGVIDGQGAATQASQAQATSAPDKSGNFVGIRQYLDANKPQASKLGDQVSGQIQGTIQGAQNEVSGIGEKFQGLANQGQISDIGNAGAQAQSITNKAASQTADQGLNDQEKNRFKEVANAQYKGPSSLIETDLYQPAASKVKEAQNYAALSKNEKGNQQLLRDLYKAPDYSFGENRLDSYLLNAGDNRAKLAESRKGADGLSGTLTAAEASAAQYAEQQKALADSIRQATQKNLVGTQTQRNTDVQKELDGISKDWRSEYDSYLNVLKNSNGGQNLQLSDEQAKKLGVEKGQRIFNILNPSSGNTPEQYLSLQEFDPNKVISKDQQAQLSALDELAGTFGGATQNKYTQKELAGTLDKATAFAADKFGLSAKEAQKAFDAASQIAKKTSSIDKSSPLYEEQVTSVAKQITDKLPWPLSDVVRWVTETVRNNVQVGNVATNTSVDGSVADYLSGQGPSVKNTGQKNLDAGIMLQPYEIFSGQADAKIGALQQQAAAEAKQNWTNQILDYLKNAGYNNRVG